MEKRERIILAALEEFVDRGFDGARVRTICDNAKANLAAISYYFGGKKELYQEVLRYIGEIPDHLDFAAALAGENSDPETFMRKWLITFLRHSASDSRLFRYRYRMVVREMLSPSPYFSETFITKMKPRLAIVKDMIRQIRQKSTSEAEVTMIVALTLAQCLFFFNKPISGNLTDNPEYGTQNAEAIAERILFSIKA